MLGWKRTGQRLNRQENYSTGGEPGMLEPGKDYEIKRSKTGLGMFAVRPIPKGKQIAEYTGPIISNKEVHRRKGKYFFGISSKESIDGSKRTNIARYINHSCNPNAEALQNGKRIFIWSKKKIQPGEEITYNYGKEYFEGEIEPVGCRCPKCNA
jgi:SET domain-containing protein